MTRTKRLWVFLVVVVSGAFALLGFMGTEVYRQAPPIPERVVTVAGQELMTKEDILHGQQVWQSIGGQQVGSIWGHGAYQAPDWSADWLHREAVALLDVYARAKHGKSNGDLSSEDQASLQERLRREMRANTFGTASGAVTVSPERASAMASVAAHYDALFGKDPALAELRNAYALHEDAVPDAGERKALTAFFFWTAWACGTERPGLAVTYTNNWPHEPLIDNRPTGANMLWSLVSIVLLLAGIGALVWYRIATEGSEPPFDPPRTDPLDGLQLTPSMKATAYFSGTVVLLLVMQVLAGALTAHFTVEGNAFFGIPTGKLVPYAVTRTWHVQLGVFWIATAFLGAGLFLAPVIGGRDPRGQRAGVLALLGALYVVVLGSLSGEWLSVQKLLGLDTGFWLGHQGYEYVDLGRVWQLALFAGLGLWLFLMLRGLWPALQRGERMRQLVLLFAASSTAIALFYGAGFFYSARTHLSVAEYWRWWVVHLWVEGFFEVFATAALSLIFARLGLVAIASAVRATLLSTAIYLLGGIPGTLHHLYFSGTPVSVMAVGSVFSALEVVPLALIGFEAWGTYRLGFAANWMHRYRWPVRFFLGVAFWNLVGAGMFGFLINPPISLYYVQGLNTTPVHAHTALFGVYGLLALGLTLLVWRRLNPEREWRDGPLTVAFWGMNGGLALMVALSLLPIGLMQAVASVDHGLWYARSDTFLQMPLVQTLRWLRMPGDLLFMVGVAAFAWFALGLLTGRSFVREEDSRLATGVEPPREAGKGTAGLSGTPT